MLLFKPNILTISSKLLKGPALVNNCYITTNAFSILNDTSDTRSYKSATNPFGSELLLDNKSKTHELTLKRGLFRKFLTWPTPKLPFQYVRKEKVPVYLKSGDLVDKNSELDLTKTRMYYEKSEELKTANEDVKRLFSLYMAPKKEVNEYSRHEFLKDIRRHPFDQNSEEVIIANLTFRIRQLLPIVRSSVTNKRCKAILNNTVLKRNKKLKLLRRMDLDSFNWLTETLQIEFKPAPLGIKHRGETRKGELRRMTLNYCQNIRNSRLDAYHEKLKEQQKQFLESKEKVMKEIEEKEEFFKLQDEQKTLKLTGENK